MGDDLAQPERNAVRTPMQWSDEANAGFSTAPAERLVRPVVTGSPFDYRRVNIAAQHDQPGALMAHVQRLIRVRRACPEVGWGACQVIETGETSVLALRCDWENGTVITLHNLADRTVEVRLPPADGLAPLRPLLSDGGDRTPREAAAPIPLGPYGFCWLRARGERR